jgi:hypothetical protein
MSKMAVKNGNLKVTFAGPGQIVLGVSGCTAIFRCFSMCTALDVETLAQGDAGCVQKSRKCNKLEMPRAVKTVLQRVDASNFQGTAAALARARWLVAYLQTNNKAYACRVSGLSHHALKRIIRMLCRNGHLEDSGRSGRPPVYKGAMLEAAYVKVVKDNTGKLTGKSLVQQLKREGQLHQTADVRRSLRHLRVHVKGKGQKLLTNYRRTTFYLSKRDEGLRLAHAHDTLRLLDAGYLSNLVFEDEVILEESPHPKGVTGWEPAAREVGSAGCWHAVAASWCPAPAVPPGVAPYPSAINKCTCRSRVGNL